jgi:hypothetical protein
MDQHAESSVVDRLAVLIGEWSMEARFMDISPADTAARAVFEWMPGQRFVIQRWEIPVPEAPDGIAVIGPDPEVDDNYLQHYFDSRGVARVYKMSLSDGIWKLWRDSPDFSPLNFSQRFEGTFSDDAKTISGAWEISHDADAWEHDFDLTYHKVSR